MYQDDDDPIKVERFLNISRDGLFTLVISPGKAVYLPVPAEIRNQILERYGIDLTKRDGICLRCEQVEEAVTGSNVYEAKIVFTIKKRTKKDKINRKVEI